MDKFNATEYYTPTPDEQAAFDAYNEGRAAPVAMVDFLNWYRGSKLPAAYADDPVEGKVLAFTNSDGNRATIAVNRDGGTSAHTASVLHPSGADVVSSIQDRQTVVAKGGEDVLDPVAQQAIIDGVKQRKY